MTKERYIGPLCIRDDFFEEGEVPLHEHVADHVLQVKRGAALVETTEGFNGPTLLKQVIRADDLVDCILIKARTFHRVTLLEPGTRTQCIFVSVVPAALLDRQGQNAELDELIVKASELADKLFRDVIVNEDGWSEGHF